MTLVLVAMAGVVLAMSARSNARDALDALDAAETLQRKWAMRSCDSLLLPRAEAVLSAAAEGELSAPHLVTRTVRLGDLQIDLTFACEDAKLNVTALIARLGPSAAEQSVQELLRAIKTPLLVDFTRSADDQSYGAWGSWLAYDHPREIATGASDYLTCWGTGKLEFRRAPSAALEVAVRPDLSMSQLGMLQRLRTDDPSISLAEALSRLELSHQQRQRLSQRLTDESATYSLWTVIHDRHRSWHAMTVRAMNDEGTSDVRLRW